MKLNIALALALIGAQAVKLTDNEEAQLPAESTGETDKFSCAGNAAGNCVNIDLKFDVKVGDGDDEDKADEEEEAAGVEVKETIALNADTEVGGQKWSDIAATVMADSDAYKLTEAYTNLSDKDK